MKAFAFRISISTRRYNGIICLSVSIVFYTIKLADHVDSFEMTNARKGRLKSCERKEKASEYEPIKNTYHRKI